MNAVIVSAHTMGLGVIRSLGRHGVPLTAACYDPEDYGQVSRYVDRAVEIPHPVSSEAAFVDALVRLGASLGPAILIPTSDASLAGMARSRERLREHYEVAFPSWEQVRLLLEKQRTHELVAAAGVAVPRTFTPRTVGEAVSLCPEVSFPALIKPTVSHLFSARFGVKMFEVHDAFELVDGYRRAAAVCAPMIQEIIPGPESAGANYNSYVVGGSPVAEFTARKVRNAPPRFGSPRVLRSERLPELIAIGRRVVAALGIEGFSCAEFKLDSRTGDWTLMEVNGRHNLSSALAVHTGVDFPWIEYRHLVDGLVRRPEPFREDVYWIDLGRDVATSVREWRTERYPLREYLRPYLGRHVFADWAPHDLRPLLLRLSNAVRRTWRRPGRQQGDELTEGAPAGVPLHVS